jgi:site-specific DNA-methyltransferase (adenine-specific)
MSTRIAIGDAREMLRLIRSETINCCVTSPPYWMLRDYGAGPKEIGREPTIKEYIEHLLEITGEIHRVLFPHGSLFFNIGDTYITQSGTTKGKYYAETGGINNVCNGQIMIKSQELPHKSLGLIPYKLAIAMQEQGWVIRNLVIWHKPSVKPESVQDRFSVDYEPIIFCTKNPQYYFKQQFRPYSESTFKRCKRFIDNGESFDPIRHKYNPDCVRQAPAKITERIAKNLMVPGQATHGMHIARANGNGRDVFNIKGANMRCVWTLPTARYNGNHFATFPEQLAAICIDAGCPPAGTVLDPFLGAGTVAVVAERMGRSCYGIEINPEYAQQARERILKERASLKSANLIHRVIT